MAKSKLHRCLTPEDADQDGTVGPYCAEEVSGVLILDGGIHYVQVNYCPFCGYKAKKQIPIPKKVLL